MTEQYYEKVVIVGIQTTEDDQDFRYSLDELQGLIENAGGEVVGELVQKRQTIHHKTFIGKGKLTELAHLVDGVDASTVVFNQALSPSHIRNIQNEVDAKIIDRIQVILDIFGLRAQSKEGQLQVELAQHDYMLPRLAGQGENMSRLGAGIGTRGPGETKLETDRRHILAQMTDIRRELKKIEAHRERNRQKRQSAQVIQIGIIGYTNAGKSTLLNRLTQTDTLEADVLFATLDPLTRQLELPTGTEVILTDTVGFIQDLPTPLIEAFKSTLEETRDADLLLHVVDASAPNIEGHEQTVYELLETLEMDDIPMLTVYNKIDRVDEATFRESTYPSIRLSAYDEDDIAWLSETIVSYLTKQMSPFKAEISAKRGDILASVREQGIISTCDFNEQSQCYDVTGYVKKGSYWDTQFNK